MSDTTITLLIAIFGSNGLFSVIVLLMNRHFSKKDKENDEHETFKMVLEAVAHDAYFDDCRRLLKKDTITEEELDNHNYLYRAYHAMGLNSTGDRMHQLVLEKPVAVHG